MRVTSTRGNKLFLIIWVSIFSNLVLTISKAWIGIVYQSQALFADGIHNAIDLVLSIIALGSMHIANRPADQEHPYGHGKAEVVASGVVAIVLVMVSLFLMLDSFRRLFQNPEEAYELPLVVAGISFIWKYVLYFYSMKIGKRMRSQSLVATAKDHLSDVYASIAAMVGISIAFCVNPRYFPLAAHGDTIAAIVVSFIILRLALILAKDSFDVLIERNVSSTRLTEIEQSILQVPEVRRIDRLRARELGHYVLVDVRVSIQAQMTIQEGHDIIRKIKDAVLNKNDDIEEVLVHLNPWYPGR